MGLFSGIGKALKKFTPAGIAGLYDIGNGLTPDYNSMFAQQSALYQEELKKRAKNFQTQDITEAGAASTQLLTGGSKPIASTMVGKTDFSALQKEYEKTLASTDYVSAISGSNLASLTGDTLARQKQINAQVKRDYEKDMIKKIAASIGKIEIGGI